MAGCGVDRAAVRAGAGNVADLRQRVEVEDADVAAGAGARDIEIAAIGIGRDVIEAAIAADQLNLLNAVRASLCMGDASERKQNGKCCSGGELRGHGCGLQFRNSGDSDDWTSGEFR